MLCEKRGHDGFGGNVRSGDCPREAREEKEGTVM